jgi:hypothetical protein
MDRICIFRIGSVGDTVVALPCFHAIRREYWSAHLALPTNLTVSAKAALMLFVLGSDSGFINDVLNEIHSALYEKRANFKGTSAG